MDFKNLRLKACLNVSLLFWNFLGLEPYRKIHFSSVKNRNRKLKNKALSNKNYNAKNKFS